MKWRRKGKEERKKCLVFFKITTDRFSNNIPRARELTNRITTVGTCLAKKKVDGPKLEVSNIDLITFLVGLVFHVSFDFLVTAPIPRYRAKFIHHNTIDSFRI